MKVEFTTLDQRRWAMHLNLDQFLHGPVMSHMVAINNDCDPAELVADHLPANFDADDDDELAQVVGEACQAACAIEPSGWDGLPFREITRVTLDPTDLPLVRQRFVAPPVLAFQFQSALSPLPAA